MRRAAAWLLAATLCTPARADPPRTGVAAYGDWRGDAPGVMRLIRPEDLPAPHATPSHSNAPDTVARPRGALPRVPEGFAATVWAEGLDTPRAIRAAPDGDIFVAESGAGRVRVFHQRPDGGVGGSEVAVSGLDAPFGIAFWPPGPAPRYVYVAETGRVLRYPYENGVVQRQGRQVVVPHLPAGGHWTRDLAVSQDGQRIFVAVGSQSNVAEGMRPKAPAAASDVPGAAWGDEAWRADVLSFDPDGGHLGVYATGLRNCAGLGTQPATGALWCVVNERDGLGDDLPPDYATHVQRSAFYGWPWFYIGDHPDSRPPPPPPGLSGSRVTVPDVLFQPHSAPLGITFYDGASFPASYRGDAFVALHGSWNRGRRTGYKVVRLPMRDGRPTGTYEDFLVGFVVDDDSVWGRPVDLAVAKDGSLLVTEDANGTIWRVARR